MNKVILIGNLTRDPELTEVKGVSLCKFTIAVNKYVGGGEKKADFFNIVAWRDLADRCGKYLNKGNKVGIVGSIEIREFEDKQGNKRTAVDISAQDVEFLTPRNDDGYSHDNSSYSTPASPSSEKKAKTLQAFNDDDIPF